MRKHLSTNEHSLWKVFKQQGKGFLHMQDLLKPIGQAGLSKVKIFLSAVGFSPGNCTNTACKRHGLPRHFAFVD